MAGSGGSYDLVVIGGGPGGYVAAIRAGQLGLKTALVEKDPQPGGTCLHRGCIPTKALLHTAHVLDSAREGHHIGVNVEGASLDLGKAMKYKGGVIAKNAKGVEYLLKKNKVTTLAGHGKLEGPRKVRVQPKDGAATTVDAKFVILATGSVPTRLPFLDFSDPRIITSDEALQLKSIPKHVTILGAGAVGVEFASILSSFGAKVTVVEMLDRLCPVEDHEVSAELLKAYKRRKIDCRVSTRLEKAEPKKEGIELLLTPEGGKSETLMTDLLLCAVGRSPYTEGLGATEAGIKFDRGFAKVDALQKTDVDNVYAIGDICNETPLLAHAASAEGIVAAEAIAGQRPHGVNRDLVPWATYCHPELAGVGLTEHQAKERGYAVKTAKFPFPALGKAGILRTNSGFFKIVSEERYGEILGVHIIGPHATDLISEACVALGLESTAADLAHIVHPHPTLSEGILEAAHGLLGGAIHI